MNTFGKGSIVQSLAMRRSVTARMVVTDRRTARIWHTAAKQLDADLVTCVVMEASAL